MDFEEKQQKKSLLFIFINRVAVENGAQQTTTTDQYSIL